MITGSTDGIGKECATQLALSAPVVTDPSKKRIIAIHGRNPEKIQKTIEDIQEKAKENATNFELTSFKADVSDLKQVQ